MFFERESRGEFFTYFRWSDSVFSVKIRTKSNTELAWRQSFDSSEIKSGEIDRKEIDDVFCFAYEPGEYFRQHIYTPEWVKDEIYGGV